jgi:hypothetical protein
VQRSKAGFPRLLIGLANSVGHFLRRRIFLTVDDELAFDIEIDLHCVVPLSRIAWSLEYCSIGISSERLINMDSVQKYDVEQVAV